MSAEYEYKVIKELTHDKLGKVINREAAEGWEPVNAYASGNVNTATHYALLRRAL